MSMVFLWTDMLMWLLLLVIILGVRSILQSPQSRQKWRTIMRSKVAMAASVVLSAYFLIALVDSVHFKVKVDQAQGALIEVPEPLQGQVLSLLDVGLAHLMVQQERTYSAPFALQEYATSVVYNEQGLVEQTYLPLKYAGAHLQEGQGVWEDVLSKSWQPLLYLLPALLLMWIVHAYFRFSAFANRDIHVHAIKLPWGTLYLTLFVLLFTLSWLYHLSHYYHVLGTDKVGQDVLYNSVKSVRTGVMIGLLTTLVMLPLALFLGISAGYFKGWVDDVIQYTYTTLNSIPGVLLIAAAVLVMQSILNSHNEWFGSTEERADLRLLFLILILGVTS